MTSIGSSAASGPKFTPFLEGRAPSPEAERVDAVARLSLSYSKESHGQALKELLDSKTSRALRGLIPQLPAPAARLTCAEFMGNGASRLAHVVCDGFIRNSRLEGSTPSQTISWLLENLEAFPGISPLLIADLQSYAGRASDITPGADPVALATKYAREIKALHADQRLLLPGGWIEHPFGHFMLYEFRKESSGNYTFNIYNSGAGSNTFHTLLYSRGKELISPLLSFKNIPLETLFMGDANNHGFIQALLEMQTAGRHLTATENASLIYNDIILSNLRPFMDKAAASQDFATPQRAGTCGYSGLIAFLRSQMPSIETFKEFQIHAKVRELTKAFTQISDLSDSGKSGFATRYLLQKGAEWLQSRLIKAYAKAPDPKFLQHIATVNFILEDVKEKNIASEVLLKDISTSSEITLYRAERLLPYTPPRNMLRALTPGILPLKPTPQPISSLAGAVPIFQTFKGANPELAKTWAVLFVKSLPMPQALPPEEASIALMNHAQNLFKILVESYKPIGTATFEQKVALFKLYSLQHALAVAIDRRGPQPPFISNFACHHLVEEKIDSLRAMDEEARLEYLSLREYFETFNAGKSYFAIGLNPADEQTDHYYRELLAHFPSILSYFRDNIAEEKSYAFIVGAAKTYALPEKSTHLDSNSGERTKAVFTHEGLESFYLLRESSLRVYNCLSANNSPRSDLRSYVNPSNPTKPAFKYTEDHLSSEKSFHASFFSRRNDLIRPLTSPLSEESEAAYLEEISPSQYRPEEINPLMSEMLRAARSEKLSCHLLIEAATNNLPLFSHKIVCEFFEALFFDPKRRLNRDKLTELLRDDPAFIALAQKFVEEGVKLFLTKRHAQPDLAPLFTILDFGKRLSLLQNELGLPQTADFPLLNQVIADLDRRMETFTSLPKGARFFLEQLKLQTLLFSEGPPDPIHFCASWVRYNWLLRSNNGSYQDSPLRTILFRRCYNELQKITALSDKDAFIKALLAQLQLPIPPEPIAYTPPLLFTSGPWRADLINCSIGGVQAEIAPQFIQVPQFQSFFGTEPLTFHYTMHGTEFDHPKGHFMINRHPGDASFIDHLYADFKEFGIGHYQQRTHLTLVLPEGLIYDYDHYTLPDGRLLITRAQDNIPAYILGTDGHITQVGKATEPLYTFKTDAELPDFTFILGGTLSFPRFSLDGEPVSFENRIATFDRRFAIETAPPQGVQGLFSHYLYLRNQRDGNDKILVPILPLASLNFPSTETALLVEPPEPFIKTYRVKAERSLPCLTFTVTKEGSLTAENNTGLLYLALLAVQKKDYDQAFHHLEELNRAIPLDKIGLNILKGFLKHKDSHPNSLALILKAATFVTDDVTETLEPYLNALDKVSTAYRLPLYELTSLLRRCPLSSLCRAWYTFITTGSWPSGITHPSFKEELDENFNLHEQEVEILTSWHNWATPKSYAAPWDVEHLQNNAETFIFTKSEYALVPWLTQITPSTWPGFFPSAYRVATSGSPVQKKLLQLQIRCCLHNTRLTLGVEQVTLLKILSAVITDPEIYPELPGDPANHGPFLGDLVKAFWDDTQAMPTALTPTPTEGPRIAEGLKGPYMPISILRTPSLEAFKCSKEIELLCTLPKAEDFFSTSLHGGYRETIRSPAALSLSPEEAVYTPHIEHSVEAFSAEISQGQESLRNVSQYTTDRAEDLKHLLSERKSALEAQDKALTVQLLEIANQTRATAEDLELEAARRQPISIESLYYLFLQRNEEAFLQENPHLKADIPRLMQMSFDSLQIKTTLQHLDRIQKALDDNELDKAGQLFAMPRNYNAQINPHYLVFEYFSDIRLYDTQVKLLEELQTKKADGTILSKVGQLMMGGGKTKVLSALLLFASARPGILPLFIVPSSLYQVVFADLSRALKSNFNRVVHPLQFTRQELTEKRCLEIEEEINFAKVSGQVVFVKSEALQVLRLQYLFECEKSLELSLGLSEKGTILGRILRIVNNESDTLIDEVHLVLAQKQEVNFPIGGKQLANARYVDMMHVFFDRLEKIPELGLKDDRQMLMSEADYKREIIPILTEAFLHSVALSTRYTAEELDRYVSGKPSKDVEDKLAADPERTLPNLAALARYTINDLFFKSFKRSCGRHFGPLPEAMALARGMEVGKIVPYQAVGTPSTTVFASWAEEAAYGFMTAFREKATMNQLTRIIDAAKYKLAEAEADDITRINEEMRALTGFTLFDLEPKENRLQALQNINTHIVQRLRLQREFLKLTIHYHDQRLSSNPQDWDLPAIRGLSGTPYNRLCYTGGLSEEERFVPDPAVEGKIVAALLKKERPLHITDTTEPEALLRSLLNADNQRRVRGFQDPGGLFKSQENLEVAKAFNKVIAGLGLEGTLFFWKKPGMAAADQIAFLRTDSEIPVPLKGSSRKDLEEQGINPDQIFIYFDERRTTGTDLPQPPNAINFTTIDILQDITSTLQSALRLRKLVSGDQAIEFVIPRDRYAKMPQDFRGIITHMVKNLAIDQSKQLYQALKQRVDSIFKKASLQALLACDSAGPVDERIALYQKLRPLMIEVTETDPFTSYGVTPESVDPDTALRQYIAAKMEQYRSTGIDLHIPADLYTVLHVQKESLPLKVPSLAPQEGIEVQLEMQAEQQVEQEVQQEIQIQQEMINELQTYQRRISPLVETEFPLAAFLTPNEERPSAYSQKIVDSMAAFPSYRMSYSTCFGDEICVTSNFAPTSEGVTLMPIFYRSHKPAHQILVERKADGAFTFTLLSLAEADTIKAGSKPMPPHLWLINDMGDYLSELAHGQTNIREAPALKQALIQIAAFNGNVQYLQRYGDACLLWLNENPALTDIKKRLITMKAQLEPLQAQAVSLSNILNCAYLPSETPKVAMAVANILARGPSELPSLFAQAALSREASIPASASLKTHQSPLNASKTPPLQGPQIPAPIPRTLAFRIFFGTLSIFLMPFVLIGLLFIRPFTKAPFKDLWSWLKRPFV